MSEAPPRQFRYVEELVRWELSSSLGGARGILESALPFVGFTVLWVLSSNLTWSLVTALAVAVVCGLVRLLQRQSLRYVLSAVVPTAIAAVVASRSGRAEDVFLPGIVYNGALAAVFTLSAAVRHPVVGYLIGAAVGRPTEWATNRALVKMTGRLTVVLAVPYVLRFVIQLPLFLAGQVVWLAVAKLVLGWPLLIAAIAVVGALLSRGRTPLEHSPLARPPTGDLHAQSA